jgi:hypothetical protein
VVSSDSGALYSGCQVIFQASSHHRHPLFPSSITLLCIYTHSTRQYSTIKGTFRSKMNSVMAPPAPQHPRAPRRRGGRGRKNNTPFAGPENAPDAPPPHAPAAQPARVRTLYIAPPAPPRVQILRPSNSSPPASLPLPREPAVITVPTPPVSPKVDAGPISPEVDAGPISPKVAPAPAAPPPFEAPDHRVLVREREAQVAAYLEGWDRLWRSVSARQHIEPKQRLPWPVENNSVDGPGWRPWGEYLCVVHKGA